MVGFNVICKKEKHDIYFSTLTHVKKKTLMHCYYGYEDL